MVTFSVGDNAGALVEADGVVLVAGASLALEPQPAVKAPIPMIAAPPATSAMRRVRVADDMVSPKIRVLKTS